MEASPLKEELEGATLVTQVKEPVVQNTTSRKKLNKKNNSWNDCMFNIAMESLLCYAYISNIWKARDQLMLWTTLYTAKFQICDTKLNYY